MPLLSLEHQAAESKLKRFCDDAVPPHVWSKLRLEYAIERMTAVIIERRPPWRNPAREWTACKVAKFKYDKISRKWSLWWPDRNQKFHPYPDLKPTWDFDVLLREVKNDPTQIFWG